MKSSISFVVAVVTLFTSALKVSAQEREVFEEGRNLFAAGYGFVTFMGALEAAIEDQGGTGIDVSNKGPFYVKYERAISDRVGFGINFAYATNKLVYKYEDLDANFNDVIYTETDTRETYSILARVNFHFGSADRFDPYVGVGMGYRDAKWTFESNDPDGVRANYKTLVKFGFETTIGARYYLTDNFGLYGEVGGAKSIFQIGLCGQF